MKKLLLLFVAVLGIVACEKFDDTQLQNDIAAIEIINNNQGALIADLEAANSALQAELDAANDNISANAEAVVAAEEAIANNLTALTNLGEVFSVQLTELVEAVGVTIAELSDAIQAEVDRLDAAIISGDSSLSSDIAAGDSALAASIEASNSANAQALVDEVLALEAEIDATLVAANAYADANDDDTLFDGTGLVDGSELMASVDALKDELIDEINDEIDYLRAELQAYADDNDDFEADTDTDTIFDPSAIQAEIDALEVLFAALSGATDPSDTIEYNEDWTGVDPGYGPEVVETGSVTSTGDFKVEKLTVTTTVTTTLEGYEYEETQTHSTTINGVEDAVSLLDTDKLTRTVTVPEIVTSTSTTTLVDNPDFVADLYPDDANYYTNRDVENAVKAIPGYLDYWKYIGRETDERLSSITITNIDRDQDIESFSLSFSDINSTLSEIEALTSSIASSTIEWSVTSSGTLEYTLDNPAGKNIRLTYSNGGGDETDVISETTELSVTGTFDMTILTGSLQVYVNGGSHEVIETFAAGSVSSGTYAAARVAVDL